MRVSGQRPGTGGSRPFASRGVACGGSLAYPPTACRGCGIGDRRLHERRAGTYEDRDVGARMSRARDVRRARVAPLVLVDAGADDAI